MKTILLNSKFYTNLYNVILSLGSLSSSNANSIVSSVQTLVKLLKGNEKVFLDLKRKILSETIKSHSGG